MKQLLKLLILLVLTANNCKAQFVTIPDTNFVVYLQQQYPGCMNGNQLDTTCIAVVTETAISFTGLNIANLSGIQYFDNIDSLTCQSSKIETIPALPPSLTYLYCGSNKLVSLPALPPNLKTLFCPNNLLTSLPPLPNSLITLYLNSNKLTTLPNIPTSLPQLICSFNQLSSLPPIPEGLTTLYINGNKLSSLPTLPTTLFEMYCDDNLLTALPALPNSLCTLVVANNSITCLPNIPTCPTFNVDVNNLPLCTAARVSDNEQNNVAVYPNPASDYLYIQQSSINHQYKIDVINMQGQVLISDFAAGINITSLPNGTYCVRLTNDQGLQFSKPFVVFK